MFAIMLMLFHVFYFMYSLAASLATLASRLAPAEGRERAWPVGVYTGASRPRENRPTVGGPWLASRQ